MDQLNRREFQAGVLGSLVTYSFLETLSSKDLFAAEIRPVAAKWLKSVYELAADVKEQRITQVAWQKQVEELFAQVELADLFALVDFERLTKDVQYPEHGARSLRISFPKVEGLPTESVFGKQIFALKKGRSVVPHGHNNMATAFLMLKGQLRGRHYDRIQDEEDAFIIRPTIDRSFAPGESSSVSDYKDNVHWFQAESDPAFIFNIHVLNVRPGSALPTGRVYLDPNGEKLADGLIRAPRLSYKDVNTLYG